MTEEAAKEQPEKPKTENPASPKAIAADVIDFVRQVDSLRESLHLSMRVLVEVHKQTVDRLQAFENDNCEVTQEGERKTIVIPFDHYQRFRRLLGRVQKSALAGDLVPKSFLVALVSQYDAFLGNLIRWLFRIKPDVLHASQKTLTLADLMAFGSVENAIEHVIEKEVEAVLRMSHSEQFDWLGGKFGLELRKGLAIWPIFIEITERRNLFVHASGTVSEQYLAVCQKHGVDLPKETARGKQLSVEPEYFKRAHACILELGVKLAHVLWRKVGPDQREAADSNLISVTYDLLAEGRYALAANLLDFATVVLKKYASEQNRRIFVVNRAQAYKWLGDEEQVRDILGAEDWSASADAFQLAAAVLLDEVDRAVAIMRRMGDGAVVKKSDYRDWPLFRQIRKDERFATAFQEIFGEPLRVTRVETTTGDMRTSAESGSDHPGES